MPDPKDTTVHQTWPTALPSSPDLGPTVSADTDRLLLDDLPVYLAVVGADLHFQYVNTLYAQAQGRPATDIIGRHLGEVLAPETLAELRPSVERTLRGETIQARRHVPFGSLGPRHLRVTQTPRRDASGAVVGLYFFLIDETEQIAAEATARSLDERFRLLSQTVSDFLWDWDPSTNRVWATHRADCYVLPPSENHFEWWVGRLHPDDRERVLDHMRRALIDASGYQVRYRLRKVDGRYNHLVDRAIILRDEHGGAVRVVGAASDVTREVEAKALLDAQKDLLERVSRDRPLTEVLAALAVAVESLPLEPLHALLTTVEGGVLRVAAAPTLPPAFVQGLDAQVIGPRAGACGSAAWFRKTVIVDDASIDPLFENARDTLALSGLRSCFSVPVLDSDGAVLAVIAIFYPRAWGPNHEDIQRVELLAQTAGVAIEHARATEAVPRQSELVATVTEASAAGLFLLDPEGRPSYMNRIAQAITGFRFDQLAASSLHTALHGGCIGDDCHLRHALERSQALSDHHTTLRKPDGSLFEAACTFTPLNHRGHSSGGLLEVRDLTEQMARRALEETNRQLNELNQLKSEFVSTMSHELRTPLNSIIGFTEVMLSEVSGPLNDVQRQHLKRVGDAGNDLLRLVSEILELSGMEAGRSQVDVSRFDLAAYVRLCVESLRLAAGQKGLTMTLEGFDRCHEMVTDENRVRQIVVNLLSNAVKFTLQGNVNVMVDEVGQNVRVLVRDTGPGIPPDRINGLFAAFSRAGIDPRNEGAGLGLHISRKLAALLGGTLEMTSRVGVGTELTLTLPRTFEPLSSVVAQAGPPLTRPEAL